MTFCDKKFLEAIEGARAELGGIYYYDPENKLCWTAGRLGTYKCSIP